MADTLMNTWPVTLRHQRYYHLLDSPVYPPQKSTTSSKGADQCSLPFTPHRHKGHIRSSPRPDRFSHPNHHSSLPPSPDSPTSFFYSAPTFSFDDEEDDLESDFSIDELTERYAKLLRHYFPLGEGWIIERNYPLWVFSDKFLMKDPTTMGAKLAHDIALAAEDFTSDVHCHPSAIDLSSIPLAVEHRSCPGEPVLILDIVPSMATSTQVEEHQLSKMNTLIDMMGWQLVDQPQCFVLSVTGLKSWIGAKVQRGGRARHSATAAAHLTSFYDLEGQGDNDEMSWCQYLKSRRCLGNVNLEASLFGPMSPLDEISQDLRDGLPDYSSDDEDSLDWGSWALRSEHSEDSDIDDGFCDWDDEDGDILTWEEQ